MAPGGWIELADFVFPAMSDDGTLSDDSAFAEWCRYALECGKIMGSELDSALHYGTQLKAAGFENIVETRYKWPQRSWPMDKKQAEIGMCFCVSMHVVFESFADFCLPPTRHFPRSKLHPRLVRIDS